MNINNFSFENLFSLYFISGREIGLLQIICCVIVMFKDIIIKKIVENWKKYVLKIEEDYQSFSIKFYEKHICAGGNVEINQIYDDMILGIVEKYKNKIPQISILGSNVDKITKIDLGDNKYVEYNELLPSIGDNVDINIYEKINDIDVNIRIVSSIEEINNGSDKDKHKTESKVLTLYSFSRKELELFVREIRKTTLICENCVKEHGVLNIKQITFHKKHTETTSLNVKKNFNNIFLSKEVENKLIKSIKYFDSKEGKDFYKKVAKPHKMGILISGSPGNGKTSLIYSIAEEQKKDVIVVDLRTYKDISEFKDSVHKKIGYKKAVIFKFDDIDCYKNFHDREKTKNEKRERERLKKEKIEKYRKKMLEKNPDLEFYDWEDAGKVLKDEDFKTYKNLIKEKNGIQLDEFLEFLDGYTYLNDSIVIMTANHPEKLDPALIRPGRIDHVIEFKNCDYYQFKNMMKYMRDLEVPEDFQFPDHKYSTSHIFNIIIDNKNLEDILKEVSK